MVQTSEEIGLDIFNQPTIKETKVDFVKSCQNSWDFTEKSVNLNILMEIDHKDQLSQNTAPSVTEVSKEQFEEDIDCINCSSRNGSLRHDCCLKKENAGTNGAILPETKRDNVHIVSQLTPNMADSLLNETVTKVDLFKSKVLSGALPVTTAQRQSSLQSNSQTYTDSYEGFSHFTKEKEKIQDFTNVPNSDDIHERRDCVNKGGHEYSSHIKCAEEFVVALPESTTYAKEVVGQEEVCEVLDLSLPKKKVRDDKKKCKWSLDSGCEGSLLMEVDEIEDETQHTEVVEEDEECWISWHSNHVYNFHLENWDQHPSVSQEAVLSPSTTHFLPPDQEETLLIDDQGIPYTLTPDGQKVPQIDPSEVPKIDPEERNPEEFRMETASEVVQGSDSAQEPLIPNLLDLANETSQANLKEEMKSTHNTTVEDNTTALPAISGLQSLPIQIVATNTASNTPILLLPPSQLQTLSSSVSNANPGVSALSLPFSLAQNAQSTPVFLVLSSPQVACGVQSSLLSGQICQISSTSCVALPSASGSLGLTAEPVSSTITNLSGQNQPNNFSSTPTSHCAPSITSSVASLSPAKQLKSDSCSDMPTSFREALLRLAVTAEQKNENQLKSIETPGLNPLSCSEETQPYSPSASDTQEENPDTEQRSSPISETASISVDQTDSLLSPNSTEGLLPQGSTSPLRSSSPIFPTNHPKNQDLGALGPRRILYCQYCPRVFYYLSDLERHSITHSQSKPHVCQLCGKAFKRSSHLERHKHIHTGQRNFMCQLCPRRFREAAELTRHQRVHTGEKPFQCLLCHMRFAERNTLRRHTKRKHQGQQHEAMDMNVKPDTDGMSLMGMQQEENEEWYSSTMTEMDSDSDTGENN